MPAKAGFQSLTPPDFQHFNLIADSQGVALLGYNYICEDVGHSEILPPRRMEGRRQRLDSSLLSKYTVAASKLRIGHTATRLTALCSPAARWRNADYLYQVFPHRWLEAGTVTAEGF